MRIPILAAALVIVCASLQGGEDTLHRVHVEGLTGSTGATVTAIVTADLELSGSVALTADAAGAEVVRGAVAGTRIEGVEVDATGRESLHTIYDGLDLRRGAHEFADDIIFALTGRPGIATSRMAFVSDQSGHSEIYICDADGKNRRRVSDDQTIAAHPCLDRTGAWITFTSYRSGYAEIYALDLIGGARRRVVSLPGTTSGASISPDGRRLALGTSDTGWPRLTVMDLDGGNRRELDRSGCVPSSPAWSADGQRVIFSCDDGTGPHLREGRAGRRASRLDLGVPNAFSPDWSPDGQRLIFVTRIDGAWRLALWERGTPRARLLAPGRDPCWGADSRHVLFSTGTQLVTLHVETGRQQTIVENFGRLGEPSWTK